MSDGAADPALAPVVTPTGGLHLRPAPEDGLSPVERVALAAAFAAGAGPGLLALGAGDHDGPLTPPLAFLRGFGRDFMTRLCATPDLEELRERATVAPPDGDELARLATAVPAFEGAEYVTAERLAAWWAEVEAAFRAQLAGHDGTVQAWLGARWSLVGRVCLHLAENRGSGSDERPFAFLATFTTRLSAKSKPQHLPLARALAQSAERKDRAALLSLLIPVERAAKESPLVAELLETGDLYQALAWTPLEAHAFLKEIPLLERAGLVVRVPDWWHARRPPRAEVTVHVGAKPPPGARLDTDALLDFDVAVSVGGDALTAAEVRALLAGGRDGLVRLRGRWVEVDRDRLRDVLAH